ASFKVAVTVTPAGSAAAGTAYSHTVTFAPAGEAGTWAVNLADGGGSFGTASFHATSTSTAATIASSIASGLAGVTGLVVTNLGGGTLLLTRLSGSDFTTTVTLTPDGQIATASTDAWTVTTPTVASGDSFSLGVDGSTYVSSATSSSAVASAFATDLGGSSRLLASAAGGVLTIIALASGIATPTLSKTNGTTTTSLNAQVASAGAQLLTLSGPVVAGETWIVT